MSECGMGAVTKEMNEAAIMETLGLFPNLTESEIGSFFLECTPFPAIPAASCMIGVRELAKRADGDWMKAVAICEADMDAQLAALK